jgi:hypothetical protein
MAAIHSESFTEDIFSSFLSIGSVQSYKVFLIQQLSLDKDPKILGIVN